jgi:ABC-type antimicrobial peptide transport system permease subunit
MLTKIPGFFFMSYRQITYSGSVLVSHSDYKRVLENLMADQTDDIMANNFRETTKGYNFTDNIPKEFLFVRLKPGLPLYRREFISNGIRAYLRDDLSFVFDIEDLKKSLESSLSLFSLFSLIVGVIAIILAFFLLLTSTNANIRDNAWELGVLKAIGVNKE